MNSGCVGTYLFRGGCDAELRPRTEYFPQTLIKYDERCVDLNSFTSV